jgi:hypothetical protein
VTKYPPPYPRKDFSFDDPIPPREDQTDYVYTQGTISVDDPTFASRLRRRELGQKRLYQMKKYFNDRKRIKLGGASPVDVTPSTDDKEDSGEYSKGRGTTKAAKSLAQYPQNLPETECIRDLCARLLEEQKARRQTARHPVMTEAFPNRSAPLDDRWTACKHMLAILNDARHDQLESKIAGVVRAVRERSISEAILREVMNVGEMIRHKRIKEGRAYQKYNPRPRKRLSQIVDLANLPPIGEDIFGGATRLLGIGASAVASAYGLDMRPLQSVYRAFRRKRTKARMTVPKAPKPEAPLPHQQEYDELVRRSAERRKAREKRAAAGTMSIDGT